MDVTPVFFQKKVTNPGYIAPTGFDKEIKKRLLAMSKFLPRLLAALALLLMVLVGCERNEPEALSDLPRLRALRVESEACSAFEYNDTIFYYREQPSYVEAVKNPQSGTYGAYPLGMVIDAATGTIDVNASESGLKYRVWFVPAGSSDTCTRHVTISGVNYLSKVYQLTTSDTLARPFYNAVRDLPPPCGDDDDDDDDDEEEEDDDDDDDDDDDGCEFDDGRDDDDGDGLADEPPAGQEIIPMGIAIDKRDGIIDLRRTVRNGTFGATPVNGTSRTVRIYYRLNDPSSKTLNHIDVTLHWYASLSQVPAALLAQINGKKAATLRVAAEQEMSRPRPPDIVLVGTEF